MARVIAAAAGGGAKKEALTLAQLSSYDDILTDALVDRVCAESNRGWDPCAWLLTDLQAYYWTTIPKNRPSYHPSRGVKEDEIAKLIQTYLIVDPNINLAEQKLLATDGLRRCYNALKTPREKLDFKDHMRRYTQIYLPDCPFEVSSTNRYTVTTHEASIVARRFIKRNEPIKYLSGIRVLITPEEEAALSVRKKDFSIVVSSRNRLASLFMGPARFANHDCGANAKLVITGQAGIDIVAVRNIDVGEEITVVYGDNYFGEDNCECLCQTCEDNLVNGWKQPDGFVPVKKSIEEDVTASQGYNTRGRRRYGRAESRSRTPSITPDLRPKVLKTKVRRLRDGDRASTAESGLVEGPGGASKRRRETDNLATPPVTPAKKQKTTHYTIAPVPLRHERAISSEDELGGATSRSESSGGEAVLTEVTTPEDTTDRTELPTQPTSILQVIDAVKQEQDSDPAASVELQEVAPFPEPAVAPVPLLETPRPPDRSHGLSIRDILNTPSVTETPRSSDRFAAAFGMSSPATTPAQTGEVRSDSPDPLSMDVVEVHQSHVESARRGRASHGKSAGGVPPSREDPVPPSRIETDRLPTPPTAGLGPTHRQPGDYELTPRLLAEPDMAWVRCMNCSTAFVQQNAYYTRASCPRCERHSKLYGYTWPKTQPEGPWDKEERVLDHRTIHRFLALDDELLVRGRAPMKRTTQTATPKREDSGPAMKRGRRRTLMDREDPYDRDSSSSTSGSDVRRSGRMRMASYKIGG